MREVNESLRKAHMDRLSGCEEAVRVYDMVCRVVTRRPEGIDDAAQHLVGQVAELEMLLELARESIRKTGITETFHNGRQRMERENRAVGTMQKCIEQQRKLLVELKITPGSRRDAPLGFLDDGFDNF